jgi:tetratricopeptide (TPR) repeat protein
MSENPVLRKAVELTMKAMNLSSEYRQQEALQLMDEAIALAEEAAVPVFQFRLQRELIRLGTSPDHSSLIPILEEAVNHYKLEGDVLEQVDALLNLSGIMGRLQKYPQALGYLDQASSAIEGLSESQIKELDERSPNRNTPMATFFRLRLNEIARRRALITGAY